MWQKIVMNAGVTIEGLATGLEQHGRLEILHKAQQQQLRNLSKQVREAEASLNALQEEKAHVKAAIATTRDGALREMEHVGEAARLHMDGLLAKLEEYGLLQQAAETLKEELALIRAFKSQDPREWAKVPRWCRVSVNMSPFCFSENVILRI
jgi:dsDNA-specific endonuclease/ATPase MutS2